QCASRFSAYAELHAEKLWDGSLSEAQRQTVRDKVDRNLRYAAEARAALTTSTPAVSRDEIMAVVERLVDAADACSPRYEDADNQVQHRVNDARAILSRLRGEGE